MKFKAHLERTSITHRGCFDENTHKHPLCARPCPKYLKYITYLQKGNLITNITPVGPLSKRPKKVY